jgi:Cd2+/Zn2+-exporting ATPase
MTTTTQKMRLHVAGMDCAGCATKIENAVGRMSGVTGVQVSLASGSVAVEHNGAAEREAICRQIAVLGYVVAEGKQNDGGKATTGHQDTQDHLAGSDRRWWRSDKVILTTVCALALAAAFRIGKLLPTTEYWVFLAALLVGFVPIARRTVAAALSGTPFSIEMLMSVAAVGAVVIGATEEAATVVLLFLVGELLEGVATSRARSSIQELTKLVPDTARLEQVGTVKEVPALSLTIGSIVQVRPGDRIPADGTILAGDGAIDEAPITGESTPVLWNAVQAVRSLRLSWRLPQAGPSTCSRSTISSMWLGRAFRPQ